MSLKERVRRHPWISAASAARPAIAALLAVTAGLAACTAGLAPSKIASGAEPASAAGARAIAGDPSLSHAAIAPRGEPDPARPGLGTSWGEAVAAPISFSPFTRAAASPWAEVVFHYNDADGVAAHARYLGASPVPLELTTDDGALSIAVVDDDGRALPGFTAGGRTLIEGQDGARYRIVVHNATAARFEVVTSVDGLDVIDGQPADPGRRGYLIDAHGVLAIDGFRTSDDAVAAFRFGEVAESYAAQTAPSGDRHVGVIGMAIFAERGAAWTPGELGRRDTADPFPERGYAAPPR